MKRILLLVVLLVAPIGAYAEVTEVIREAMKNNLYRDRVKAIVASKAYTLLKQQTGDEVGTPTAAELAWAKAATVDGYSAYTEALLILSETAPATINAVLTATDVTYGSKLDIVFNEIIEARN